MWVHHVEITRPCADPSNSCCTATDSTQLPGGYGEEELGVLTGWVDIPPAPIAVWDCPGPSEQASIYTGGEGISLLHEENGEHTDVINFCNMHSLAYFFFCARV